MTCPPYMLQGGPRPATAGSRRPRGAPVNLLDWVLILVVLLYAVSGYWQGFVTGAFATVGLLLGGLVGVWLAPEALGDATPSILVSLAAIFIVIVCASLGQARLPAGRHPHPRPHHLAAGPGPGRGRRCRAQRGRRAAGRLGARGRALRLGAPRHHAAWCATPRCSPRSTPSCPTPPAPSCRRSTTSSGRRSSRATSSRSRPERIVAVPPGPRRMLTDPDVTAGRGGRGPGPQHQPLRPGHRGLRLRLRPRPGDDQRPRRRRRLRPGRRRRRQLGVRPRRLLRPRTRRRRDRRTDRQRAAAAVRDRRPPPARGWRSWATRRTAPTTCRPAGSGPTSGCARPTSTARAP